MCVLWSSALETCVPISDLWAKDGKDSRHVFQMQFRCHIVTFSHFIGLPSAKIIYLLDFMMETLANMRLLLLLTTDLEQQYELHFLYPKLPFRTSVDIRAVTRWV